MENNIEKYTINVGGMSCGHCKNAVEQAISALPGVVSAEVDLVAKTLTVKVDSGKTTLDQIKEAVDDVGFDVL